MARKNNSKRKKSSDSGSDKQKLPKHGGGSTDSLPGEGAQRSSGVEEVPVSQLLKSANDILYPEVEGGMNSLDMSANSVFEARSQSPASQDKGVRDSKDPLDPLQEPTNRDILSYLMKMDNKFTARISAIESRLEKLEKVEGKVDCVEKELKGLRVKIHDGQKKIEEKLRVLEEKQDSTDLSVGLTSDRVKQLEEQRDRLKDDFVYLQSQSMRNNLLFSGLPEARQEAPAQTEETLRQFLAEKLGMAQDLVDKISFERVHRMGSRTGARPRTVVAKFTMFKDREAVRKLRTKLEGTNCYINEQFPKEVMDRRKLLLPRMKAARRQGKEAWISYDKLYIDGRVATDAE